MLDSIYMRFGEAPGAQALSEKRDEIALFPHLTYYGDGSYVMTDPIGE